MAESSKRQAEPSNSEPDPKKKTYEPETRAAALKMINDLVFYLINVVEGISATDELMNKNINIDRSNAYAGFVSVFYTHMRKMSNENQTTRGKTYEQKEFRVLGQTLKLNEVLESYNKTMNNAKCDFKVATPLVDLLCAFKMSYDELRMSTAKFTVRIDEKPVQVSLSQYGLSNCHLPLMNGLTYKPERRTGLLRTLGPLSLSIILTHEKNKTEKTEAALTNAIKHLPMCSEIVSCLRYANDAQSCRSLYKALGDVLLITGARNGGKCFFPLLFFVKSTTIFHKGDEVMEVQGKEERVIVPQKIVYTFDDVDFSGRKGLLWYHNKRGEYHWSKSTLGTAGDIAQMIFLAMFGTAYEDLGILGTITTQKEWRKRSEVGNTFKMSKSHTDASTAAEHHAKFLTSTKFNPIGFRYISKMAAANMTRNTGTTQPMLIGRMVFSGIRQRFYSDAFMKYLDSGEHSVGYGRDANSLGYALHNMKKGLKRRMREEDLNAAGTTKWYAVRGCDTLETDDRFQETGEYFYS